LFQHSFTNDEKLRKVIDERRSSSFIMLPKQSSTVLRNIERRAATIVSSSEQQVSYSLVRNRLRCNQLIVHLSQAKEPHCLLANYISHRFIVSHLCMVSHHLFLGWTSSNCALSRRWIHLFASWLWYIVSRWICFCCSSSSFIHVFRLSQ